MEHFFKSPLNYTGGKYKLLSQILPLFPKEIDIFVDLFCGGCNVGINVLAKEHWYNDISIELMGLYQYFVNCDINNLVVELENLIDMYELSNTYKNGYNYYNCDSSKGLSAYNKEKFLVLRKNFNNCEKFTDEYFKLFFLLIVFGFNNQIRFNKNGEYNLPVGKRDFNLSIRTKLCDFIEKLKSQKLYFSNQSFEDFDYSKLSKDSLVYCDPPYLISRASYNENGAWSMEDEQDLLNCLNKLNSMGIKFALSNVLEHKGKKNELLESWIKEKGYTVHKLDFNYNNSNYHSKNKESKTVEVLITNYVVLDKRKRDNKRLTN